MYNRTFLLMLEYIAFTLARMDITKTFILISEGVNLLA